MDSSLGQELDDSHLKPYLCSLNEMISHLCGSALSASSGRHSCCPASACPFPSLCSSCSLVDYPNHRYQPFWGPYWSWMAAWSLGRCRGWNSCRFISVSFLRQSRSWVSSDWPGITNYVPQTCFQCAHGFNSWRLNHYWDQNFQATIWMLTFLLSNQLTWAHPCLRSFLSCWIYSADSDWNHAL